MKETLKISDRFNLIKKLGQGTFSFIYEAFDKILQRHVALKIEKKDKNKSILMFEYNVLNVLKGLTHVCNVYDFVKNSEQNLIVMDLLGNNLAKVRKCLEENYNFKIAIQLLIEMLDAIEEVHDRGFIHRDVKASNFVLSQDNKHVYIVDFGLAKKHLDDKQIPVAQRKKADFRGTVSFASLNAHNNIDLSRRDDMWSLYFVILDFLNEKLKWREQKEYTMDEVKNIKNDCLNNPEEKLWIVTKDIPEVKKIFYHIQSLQYKDKPNYAFIREQLRSIYIRNMEIPQMICPLSAGATVAPYIIQHQPQNSFQIFTTNSGAFNSKLLPPQQSVPSIVEFQTPERPQHQKCSIVNHQNTPSTPQNQSLGINDEAAFSRASPQPSMQNQQFTNYSSYYIQNGVKKFPQDGQCPSPVTRTVGIKRKGEPLNYEQIKQESLNPEKQNEEQKQQTNNDDKRHKNVQNQKSQLGSEINNGNVRKRDLKGTHVNVIQDEEPILSKPNDLFLQGQPTSNGILYQVAPATGNCVNQHININQNFYLSPHFVLYLKEQQGNPIGIQGEPNFSNATTQISSRVASVNTQGEVPVFAPQEPVHILNPTAGLINVQTPTGPALFNKIPQPFFQFPNQIRQQQYPTNGLQPIISLDKGHFVNQSDLGANPQQQFVKSSINTAATYTYNPRAIEVKNRKSPIFKVEIARSRQQQKQTSTEKIKQNDNMVIIKVNGEIMENKCIVS